VAGCILTQKPGAKMEIAVNTLNPTQWYGVSTSVNAYNPGTAVTQASRGTSRQATSTRDPHNVQMSVKLYW